MISIHSLRVEGDDSGHRLFGAESISIHSLRVEGDDKLADCYGTSLISIHSLRVEGDPPRCPIIVHLANFNPLPPCGGRRHCASLLSR